VPVQIFMKHPPLMTLALKSGERWAFLMCQELKTTESEERL